MAKIIAMAGKGGTGKTTLAALLIRSLLGRGLTPVLAVDADPNATLPEALGIDMPTTIGQIREEFGKQAEQLPPGMTKGQWFDYQLNSIVVETEGMDLLVMGRQEGPGCYCYINNLLRGAVEKLAESYQAVVIDNEAGLEHLSRRTSGSVDLMVVVSDHSVRGIRSAHRVLALVEEMGIQVKDWLVVVNRVVSSEELPQVDQAVREEAALHSLEIFAAIPVDPGVITADLEKASLLATGPDSPSARVADRVIDHLLRHEN